LAAEDDLKATASRQLRNAAFVAGIVFALAAIAGIWFAAVMALAAWGVIVAGIHALYFRYQTADLEELEAQERAGIQPGAASDEPRRVATEHGVVERYLLLPAFQRRGQLVVLGLGAAVTGWLVWRAWRMPVGVMSATALQMGMALAIGLGVLLSFVGRYAVALGEKLGTRALAGVAQLARLAFWVGLAVAGSFAGALSASRDYRLVTGWVIAVVTAVLVVDVTVRALLRLYRPREAREAAGPVGESVILDLVLRQANPWEELTRRLEAALGVQIEGVWVFQFGRRMFGPLLLTVAVLAWVATTATVVPVGHAGVRVQLGRFIAPAVGPGWHWTWPWPFETIRIVPTGRVEELVLGFATDTGQPILWTEKHYEGEKNLLVGAGDELLTIGVPVQYRVRDPLAFLRTTVDARVALEHLAYRHLLRVTSAREGFAVMTRDREEVREALHAEVQAEADRLGLGLEVVWVGLRDIHPPVEVTPAYQDVISAEEERGALIELSRAYAAETMPAARQEANRLRTTATATARQRAAVATGEAERFRLVAAAQREQPELFRARLTLETLAAALAAPAKVVVGTDAPAPPELFLDLRPDGSKRGP